MQIVYYHQISPELAYSFPFPLVSCILVDKLIRLANGVFTQVRIQPWNF